MTWLQKKNDTFSFLIQPQQHGKLISPETIEGVVHAIAKQLMPQRIILFGSYASGIPTPDSDLDLLVVMPSDLPWHKRTLPIRTLFQHPPCAMDLLVYTPEEVAYWQGTLNHVITEALQSGKILYERTQR